MSQVDKLVHLILRQLLLLTLLVISIPGLGQLQVSVVYEGQYYRCYVSGEIDQPLYVKYKLHKIKRSCIRDELNYPFKRSEGMVGNNEYTGSNYDRGHMAPAADFGSECEATFRYNNCVPQTPTLNRGIWKTVGENLRQIAKGKELLILCGGTFAEGYYKEHHNLRIPKYCWKIVIYEDINRVMYCWISQMIIPNES